MYDFYLITDISQIYVYVLELLNQLVCEHFHIQIAVQNVKKEYILH